MQEPRRGFPVRRRHGERVLRELPGEPGAHGPANHGARVEVEHQREVESALRSPDVVDVPGPHPVRLLDLEQSVQGIGGHRPRVVRIGRGAPLLHGLGPDAFDAHEPRDAVLADSVPLLDQGVPDAGTAVGRTRLLVDHPDGREQGAVVHDRRLSGRSLQA